MDTIRRWLNQHFDDLKSRHVDAVIDHYANRSDLYVHVEGPRWTTIGHDNVKKGWQDFFASKIQIENIAWVEGPFIHAGTDMASASGIVDIHIRVDDHTSITRLRGTYVLEHEGDAQWRVVHEHFSQPAQDPYGIVDWLKTNA